MYETDLKRVERASFNDQKSDERQNAENESMFVLWSSKHDYIDNLKKQIQKMRLFRLWIYCNIQLLFILQCRKIIHMNRIYHAFQATAKCFQNPRQKVVSFKCQMTSFKVILTLYVPCGVVEHIISFSSATFKIYNKTTGWIISFLIKIDFERSKSTKIDFERSKSFKN